jgi:hypothetical protein
LMEHDLSHFPVQAHTATDMSRSTPDSRRP